MKSNMIAIYLEPNPHPFARFDRTIFTIKIKSKPFENLNKIKGIDWADYLEYNLRKDNRVKNFNLQKVRIYIPQNNYSLKYTIF